jgi:hypothetical protein
MYVKRDVVDCSVRCVTCDIQVMRELPVLKAWVRVWYIDLGCAMSDRFAMCDV